MTYEFVNWANVGSSQRLRTRKEQFFQRSLSTGSIYTFDSIASRFRDFPKLRFKNDDIYVNKPCEHHSVIGSWSGISDGFYWQNLATLTGADVALRHAFEQAAEDAALELDFQEDNNFELFPFLFDIDGKLGNFFSEFVGSLTSPAGIKFGLLPTISDFISLFNSWQTAFGGFEKEINSKSMRRTTISGPVYVSGERGDYAYELTGTWVLQGTPNFLASSFEPIDFFYLWLDEFGIHPDFKTAWDVLPFSFIADKIVPVGDLLEYLHPRGWYQPEITFEDCTFSVNGITSIIGTVTDENRQSIRSYGRHTKSPIIGSRKPNVLEYESPDFEGALQDVATILVSL
jgi:hypothetical protein